ncbi:hypothetical protein CFAL_05435 [Corynebacterium falsenii DSM 44353]|uniref:hypothetical protein n=1 Tax=Corynebacterium falsenii TaxID=108486 RepID=UPI0003E94464|nr:hypothetical protein [Corynebacterium falsenii]AHI03113.1 hypothetical protein CFAL_05435 [Corynebacterium falsenii DSM 44353]UBI03822.1 hypothetical protein LA343_07320 [Corynebacterium falsenii]UBI06167.1 hypothetical protein LA329_07675 [Corynebacterium falsenii]
MTHPESVSLREQLWSPVQNTAAWLGWWAHGAISTDELIDAFAAVQGKAHSFIPDANLGDSPARPGITEMLRFVRAATDGAPVGVEQRPLVSLSLTGPGDAAFVPAGSDAARELIAAGAGLVVADADPDVTHVLIPSVHPEGIVEWRHIRAVGPTAALPVYSPGEADQMLREASDRATQLIRASGYVPQGRSQVDRARLAVGALHDAFGLPGLPPGMAPRAAGLMARADTVAAIVEVTKSSHVGASVDPHVLPLMRAVRTARMVAIDYAMRELVREQLS